MCFIKTYLELNLKNIDISSNMCSGLYPYTLSFKSIFEYLVFIFGEVLKKINLEKYGFCFKPKF